MVTRQILIHNSNHAHSTSGRFDGDSAKLQQVAWQVSTDFL